MLVDRLGALPHYAVTALRKHYSIIKNKAGDNFGIWMYKHSIFGLHKAFQKHFVWLERWFNERRPSVYLLSLRSLLII